MDQTAILIIGVFVLLMLIGGVGFTIMEFSKMAKEPKKYNPPAYDEEEESSEEKETDD
ncbi:MAG: hypothetical protein ACE5I1_03625 [bacterium]